MTAATILLDLMSAAIALSVIVRRVIRYRRLRIDHVLLFCIGHLYYMSFGSLVFHLRLLENTYAFVFNAFAEVTPLRAFGTSLWSLLLLVSFLAGCRAADGRTRRVGNVRRPAADARSFAPTIAMTALVLVAFLGVAFQYRGVIAEGYSSLDPKQIQEQSGRGVLSAAAAATILAALFTIRTLRLLPRSAVAARALGWTLALVSVAVPAGVLLLGGGRMYVATSLVAGTVWWGFPRRPIRRKLLLSAAGGGFVLLTLLGSLRIGELPSSDTIGFFATSESVLNEISHGYYLSSEQPVFEPINAPRYLVSDLSNILPRALFPDKDSLRADPQDDGFRVNSALGAVHLAISAILNFGVVGSLVVAGLGAYALTRLRDRVSRNPDSVAVLSYATISAALTFSIFRDPFSISIVRWMIVNGLVLPLVYGGFVLLSRRRTVERGAVRLAAST